jgi:hypothetical protein
MPAWQGRKDECKDAKFESFYRINFDSYVFVILRAKPLHLCAIFCPLFFREFIYHIISKCCDVPGFGTVIAEDFIAVIFFFGSCVDINHFFVFQILFI